MNSFWDNLIIFAAKDLPWVIGLTCGTLGLWSLRFSAARKKVIGVGGSVLVSWAVTAVIKSFYESPRPYIGWPPGSSLLTYGSGWDSFPSGHAAVFFALAFSLLAYRRRLGLAVLGGAILISGARVLAGLHWPLDVVGGAGVALFSTFLWLSFVRRLGYNKKQ